MTLLSQILDVDELDAALAARHVAFQDCRDLRILNYTPSCAYDRAWSDVTLACRGLIYRPATGEVVARPWPKFFNYGEHPEGTLDLSAPAEVTDKMDGSLGILYEETGGELAVATRGSFEGEQALHATEILRARYPDFRPIKGLTYLFEIVYPANRIVLDYGAADDLFFLGAVEIATGLTIGPLSHLNWSGPRASTLPASTLGEALALEPRPNAEGVVVRFLSDGGALVKIKQEDYVALHRIVTGLNERTVWEHLGAGGTIDELCEPLPDEFREWVEEVAWALLTRRAEIMADAVERHEWIAASAASRKEYAAEAVETPELRPYLFMLLDGKDPSDAIWRSLRPAAARPMVLAGEDAA